MPDLIKKRLALHAWLQKVDILVVVHLLSWDILLCNRKREV